MQSLDVRNLLLATTHKISRTIVPLSSVTCSSSTVTSDYMATLLGATNLQALLAKGWFALTGVMILSNVAGMKMHRLTITLSDAENLSTLGYIKYFSNLIDLHITFTADTELGQYHYFDAWKLAHLRHATILTGTSSGSALTRFLARCIFPSLRQLCIDTPIIFAESSTHLVALLSSCNDIKEVWFNVPGMSDHQILLPGVRAHTLELTPTNPTIITHLSPKTKTFRINSTVASAQPESLWILLDAILSQETHLSSLIVYGDGFNWMSYRNARGELPAGTSIIPDLLRYAAKLSAKGIPLKDSKGKTVTDYFTSV
jgi:hypothetical protein